MAVQMDAAKWAKSALGKDEKRLKRAGFPAASILASSVAPPTPAHYCFSRNGHALGIPSISLKSIYTHAYISDTKLKEVIEGCLTYVFDEADVEILGGLALDALDVRLDPYKPGDVSASDPRELVTILDFDRFVAFVRFSRVGSDFSTIAHDLGRGAYFEFNHDADLGIVIAVWQKVIRAEPPKEGEEEGEETLTYHRVC